jgi:hypothetical protein
VLNEEPRHEDVLGSGGIAPSILEMRPNYKPKKTKKKAKGKYTLMNVNLTF